MMPWVRGLTPLLVHARRSYVKIGLGRRCQHILVPGTPRPNLHASAMAFISANNYKTADANVEPLAKLGAGLGICHAAPARAKRL